MPMENKLLTQINADLAVSGEDFELRVDPGTGQVQYRKRDLHVPATWYSHARYPVSPFDSRCVVIQDIWRNVDETVPVAVRDAERRLRG